MLAALRESVVKMKEGVDEELDREVRHKLKAFREGTPEWEDEYARLINSMRIKATPAPETTTTSPA